MVSLYGCDERKMSDIFFLGHFGTRNEGKRKLDVFDD